MKNNNEPTGKFLFKMDQSLSEKNKLDEEIKNFLWSIDGTLISTRKDLKHFKDSLQEKVKEIHTRHPRCQEIQLNIWGSPYSEKEDLSVACGCCKANIYSVNIEFQVV